MDKAVGTKTEFGKDTFIFSVLNKDLPGLFFYISCKVFIFVYLRMYSLNSIIQAGAANAYSHLFFVLFAINEAKNHLMVF